MQIICRMFLDSLSAGTTASVGIVFDVFEYLFYYLILVFVFVLWMYGYILYSFYFAPSRKDPVSYSWSFKVYKEIFQNGLKIFFLFFSQKIKRFREKNCTPANLQQSVTLLLIGCVVVYVTTHVYEYYFLGDIEEYIRQYDETWRLYCLQNNIYYDAFRQKVLYDYWRMSNTFQYYTVYGVRVASISLMSYTIFGVVKGLFKDSGSGSSSSSSSEAGSDLDSGFDSGSDAELDTLSTDNGLQMQRTMLSTLYGKLGEFVNPCKVALDVVLLKLGFRQRRWQPSEVAYAQIVEVDFNRLVLLVEEQASIQLELKRLERERNVNEFDESTLPDILGRIETLSQRWLALEAQLKKIISVLGDDCNAVCALQALNLEQKDMVSKIIDDWWNVLNKLETDKQRDFIKFSLKQEMLNVYKEVFSPTYISDLSSKEFDELCEKLQVRDIWQSLNENQNQLNENAIKTLLKQEDLRSHISLDQKGQNVTSRKVLLDEYKLIQKNKDTFEILSSHFVEGKHTPIVFDQVRSIDFFTMLELIRDLISGPIE